MPSCTICKDKGLIVLPGSGFRRIPCRCPAGQVGTVKGKEEGTAEYLARRKRQGK